MFTNSTDTKVNKNSLSLIKTVQPVPAPFSTNALNKSSINEGGNNQNDMLFNLGKAISGAPTCKGKK